MPQTSDRAIISSSKIIRGCNSYLVNGYCKLSNHKQQKNKQNDYKRKHNHKPNHNVKINNNRKNYQENSHIDSSCKKTKNSSSGYKPIINKKERVSLKEKL